jgi:hypothetical protein
MKVATVGLLLGITVAVTAPRAAASPIPLSGGGDFTISAAATPALLTSSCFSFPATVTCLSTPIAVQTSPGGDPLFGLSGQIHGLALNSTSITDFLTMNSLDGTLNFDLTGFVDSPLGGCTVSSTTACVLSGTDVVLTPLGTTQVGISFSILADGLLGNTTTATGFTPYQGSFSTQLAGTIGSSGLPVSIANIVTYLNTPTNGIPLSWSANFQPVPTTPVPEPASMLLFGSGFGAAILRLRRRKA